MRGLASSYIDIPALRPGAVGAYALAFVCAAVATVLRIAFDPYVVSIPFITYFPAVIITALISGFGAKSAARRPLRTIAMAIPGTLPEAVRPSSEARQYS